MTVEISTACGYTRKPTAFSGHTRKPTSLRFDRFVISYLPFVHIT